MYVEIETAGEYTKGATIEISITLQPRPNATVLMDVDRENLLNIWLKLLNAA